MTLPTAERIFDAAERHADTGDWRAARAGYLQVLSLDPGHAGAMLQLSYIESLAGRFRSAREWVLRAAAGEPPSRAETMLDLVRRLRTFNEVPTLRRLAARLLEDAGTSPVVLVEAARQLSNLNDFDIALRCAEAALQKAPGAPGARLVRGQLLAHHGRVDEAEADFVQVLEREPRMASGWWLLARLRRQTPRSNHVVRIQALLRTPGLDPPGVAAAARGLHKELDDLGDHEGAWRALELMCRARRENLRYDPRWTRELVDDLVAWSRGVHAADGIAKSPEGGTTPIFIIGMHRSGTTLLEQLLDASPQVRGVGELNDFAVAMRFATDQAGKGPIDRTVVRHAGSAVFDEVGRHYMQGLAWRLGDEPFFTDKQPANFLSAGFICRALPQAKLLHLVRDPVETCFSNLRELFSEINPHSYDQRELADYFLQYRRLMAHWHAAFPGRILDVPYAALTEDADAAMRRVAAWCGIDYVPAMSDPRSSVRAVSTASGIQVRERIARRESPKWAPYAGHLQPLIRALRDGGVEVPEPRDGE